MNIKAINYKIARHFSLNLSSYQSKNHYDCLGITPKATQGDVKTAYYSLSKQYHPDLNKGNVEAASKFRDITAAYEILGNVKARKLYDRRLSVGVFDDTASSVPEEPHDYQHSSFYKHRNKPARKKQSDTQTANFNIDEWTKAHYTKTFEKSWSKKQETADYIITERGSYESISQTWQTMVLLMLSITVMALAGFKEDFDKPSVKPQPNTTSDDKPD